MLKRYRAFIGAACLAALLGSSTLAVNAQTYPDRPATIVVPFPPGGGTDILGRVVAEGLAKALGQPFVVNNRPGAAGVIGSTQVSRSAPDGYTLLMAATGALAPPEQANAGSYDVKKDFAPISLVAAPPYLLVVNAEVPAKSVQELIELAKKQPGKLHFASSGAGAASHLAAELFKSMTGTNIVHVPYKGMGQAVTDVISGTVPIMFAPPPAVLAQVEAGKLRVLAATSAKRSPLFPNYPTVAEAGVPGYEAVGWFGFFAPANTSGEIVERLNKEVAKVLRTPMVEKRLAEMGAVPGDMTPAEFAAFINSDTEKWLKLSNASGK